MRVAHFIDSGGLYGAEKMLLTLCLQQKKQSIDPTIISVGTSAQERKLIESECDRLGIDCISWRMKPGLNIRGTLALLDQIKDINIDLFHSHGYKFNILLSILKWKHRTPTISTIHGRIPSPTFSKMWFNQTLESATYRFLDYLVCVTSRDVRKIAAPPSKISVVFNGIDFDTPEKKNDRNRRSIAYVGRLSFEKGAQFLPAAAQQLAAEDISVTFHIYGEGPLKERIQEEAKLLNVESSIITLGYCNQPVAEMIRHDAIVMPSLTEGLPISLLEAIATKTIPIVTKVGEVPSVLGEDYPFYIGNPECTKSISDAIARFYKTDSLSLEKLAIELRERAKTIYSSHAMTNEYATIYRATLR